MKQNYSYKILIIGLCWLISACAQQTTAGTSGPPVADKPHSTPQRQALLNNVSFGQVMALPQVDKSIKLAYGESPLEFGQLYLPAGKGSGSATQTKAPLIIFIHGGCWLNAFDIHHSTAFSSALARAGYAVWSLEYRRTGDEGGGWPGSFNDVLQGVRFAETLTDHPINLDKIILTGHSAGGHLALLAGATQHRDSPDSSAIKAVIGLAAITDVIGYSQGSNSCQTATPAFMGGSYEAKPSAYTQANPRSQALHPTSRLLQGNADAIVPPSQATDSGLPLVLIEAAGHFDWIHPHTQAFQEFLTQVQEILAP